MCFRSPEFFLCAFFPVCFLSCEFSLLHSQYHCALTQPAHQAPYGFPLPRLPGDSLKVASWGSHRDDLVYFPLHRDRCPSLPDVLCFINSCFLYFVWCLDVLGGRVNPALVASFWLQAGLWILETDLGMLCGSHGKLYLSWSFGNEHVLCQLTILLRNSFGLLLALIDYISDHRITHDLVTAVTHHDWQAVNSGLPSGTP